MKSSECGDFVWRFLGVLGVLVVVDRRGVAGVVLPGLFVSDQGVEDGEEFVHGGAE